jgi:photosystem I subunit 9
MHFSILTGLEKSFKIDYIGYNTFFYFKNKKNKNNFMKDFTTYLSTAPVIATVWFTFTAGLLIEINRFFPDPLVFSF